MLSKSIHLVLVQSILNYGFLWRFVNTSILSDVTITQKYHQDNFKLSYFLRIKFFRYITIKS